jgi:hypothetical protein
MKSKTSFKVNTDFFQGTVCFRQATRKTRGRVVTCYIYDDILEATCKGTAICHPEDTFDEQVGMAVAYNKAIFKWLKIHGECANWLMKKAEETQDLMTSIFQKRIEKANIRCNR